MGYQINIEKRAVKQLLKLDNPIIKRIYSAINELENNPRPQGIKKMKVQNGYRLRVGNYRVLYTIDDNNTTITVYKISHRKNAYDN